MATISLTSWEYYRNGVAGVSAVVGYEGGARRVARATFSSPPTGATSIVVTWHTAGRGAGAHIPIKFYIGTDPNSHANAGPGFDATGNLAIGSDWLTFSGSADLLLTPNQTYYLWIFPGEDTFGWYNATRKNYTSTLSTSGVAVSDVSGAPGELGQEHTLTIVRYSDELTHTITASSGSDSVMITSKSTEENVRWTPPISWSAHNTTGTTVAVTVKCTTYIGTVEIGATTTDIIFTIPETVVPSAFLSVVDPNGNTERFGDFVQNRSKARAEASGSGVYGSTIKVYELTGMGMTVSADSAVFNLPNPGVCEFAAKVTDSRGRSSTAKVEINVLPYANPTATILSAYRSDKNGNQDDDGEHATIVFRANVSPVGNKNTAAYTVKYRVKGGTSWTSSPVNSAHGNYSPDGVAHVIPIHLNSAYEICVAAADWFTAVESLYRTVQVAFSLLSFHRATKAVGIGQKATEPGVCAFGIPAKFNGGIVADGKTLTFVYRETVGGYILEESQLQEAL